MIKKKGFTLFELLVSISIIAILTAMATISYGSAQKKARDSKRVQDMLNIQKAEEQIFMLNNANYLGVAPATGGCNAGGAAWTVNGTVILQSPPEDPKTSYATYNYSSCGPNSYCFCAHLEGNTGNSSINNCTGWVNGTGAFYCVINQQ
jgi:prepilin-type N-terminal cleavage/methylation domain-containing protein